MVCLAASKARTNQLKTILSAGISDGGKKRGTNQKKRDALFKPTELTPPMQTCTLRRNVTDAVPSLSHPSAPFQFPTQIYLPTHQSINPSPPLLSPFTHRLSVTRLLRLHACHAHGHIPDRDGHDERDDTAGHADADEVLDLEVALAGGIFLHDGGCRYGLC